jgi:hypothetical protein
VGTKQKERARQIFQRSADQAGFFAYGRNKLVRPIVDVQEAGRFAPGDLETAARNGFGGYTPNDASGAGNLHPLIVGLMQALPEQGKPWAEEKRRQWVTAAEHIFGLLYPDEEAEPAAI